MRWLALFLSLAVGTASAATLQVTIDASSPTWDTGAAVASTAGWYVRIYKGAQGQVKSLYDAKPWATTVRFISSSSSTTAVYCFDSTFAVDVDGDGKPDIEGVHSGEWCGTHADAPVVLLPAAPRGISGKAPAP
jgi:hypothetical protein